MTLQHTLIYTSLLRSTMIFQAFALLLIRLYGQQHKQALACLLLLPAKDSNSASRGDCTAASKTCDSSILQ